MTDHLHISVVVPVYNEQENLPELHRRLAEALAPYDYEVLFVDDGSRDASLAMLLAFHKANPRMKALSFSRNFGHQVAISAGIDHAAGGVVILMDGDLQDPPEVLPRFVDKWREGFEVVYAVRRRRKEGVLKRIAYAAFYRLLRKISYLNIPLDSGDFCLMDRKVVDVLKALPERTRFVRGLRTWAGYRQTGLEYEREKRFAGRPKYTFGKLLKLAYDGIVAFSDVPLRLAIYLGLGSAAAAFLGGLVVVYEKVTNNVPVVGWTSTIIAILFLGGMVLLTLGIIGEYISRIYEEVKHRPLYIIRERIGV
jgi:polyisoprenyl-phosphate glycosyltransferase